MKFRIRQCDGKHVLQCVTQDDADKVKYIREFMNAEEARTVCAALNAVAALADTME